MSRLDPHRHIEKHIDKKLRNRLRIYFCISFILVCAVIYEIVMEKVTWPFAFLGVGGGIFLGMATARMFHLSWNHDAKQIVSRLDELGVVILVAYTLFSVFRGWIIGHFIHGSAVGGVSVAVATGAMIGRVLGTRGRIIKILREQKVFT